jgi:Mn-dependent DtxR family transcriptional regulator
MIILKDNEYFHTVRGYQMLNSENKLLTSSMEDYLEMIHRTCINEGYIRIKQLSSKLNVKPASSSRTIQKLKDLNLVNYEKYGIIKLTDEGRVIGEFLLRRHQIIDEFLKNLGIKETLKDTEMVEHDISINTLKNILIFNKFLLYNSNFKKEYNSFRKKISKDINLNYPI